MSYQPEMYSVTVVDENGDSYTEDVRATNPQIAAALATAAFVRDLSNRKFKVVSVVNRSHDEAAK